MKRCWVIFFVCMCSLLSVGVVAQSHKVQLKVSNIKCLELTESDHDELYFMLSILDKHGKYSFQRVPEYPKTLTFSAGEIKSGISLWSGQIDPSEPLEVLISVMEHDASAVNADDLVGVAKVQLQIHDNKLDAKWNIPKSKHIPRAELAKIEDTQQYDMYGAYGHYQVGFEIVK